MAFVIFENFYKKIQIKATQALQMTIPIPNSPPPQSHLAAAISAQQLMHPGIDFKNLPPPHLMPPGMLMQNMANFVNMNQFSQPPPSFASMLNQQNKPQLQQQPQQQQSQHQQNQQQQPPALMSLMSIKPFGIEFKITSLVEFKK